MSSSARAQVQTRARSGQTRPGGGELPKRRAAPTIKKLGAAPRRRVKCLKVLVSRSPKRNFPTGSKVISAHFITYKRANIGRMGFKSPFRRWKARTAGDCPGLWAHLFGSVADHFFGPLPRFRRPARAAEAARMFVVKLSGDELLWFIVLGPKREGWHWPPALAMLNASITNHCLSVFHLADEIYYDWFMSIALKYCFFIELWRSKHKEFWTMDTHVNLFVLRNTDRNCFWWG